jgi:hypothetical protein
MAVDFGLLNTQLPEQIATSFSRGYEGAQQNQLARQKMAQEQETNALRRQEAELGLQRTRGLMQQEEEAQKNARLNQKISGFRERILRARTPDDARKIVQMQYSDADISPVVSQYATLEQSLAEVPDEPTQFQEYLQKEAMGIDEWLKSQAQANVPKVVGNAVYIPSERRFVSAPQQRLVSVIGPQGQPIMVPADQAVGMTPLTAATARMAGIGAPSRAAAPTRESVGVAAPTEFLTPKEREKREAKFPQATLAIKGFESKTNTLIKDLKALRNHEGLNDITGLIAGRIDAITSAGREAQAQYDKITARGQFQELQDMRNASPTGGALGNVSNTEGEKLRAAFAALDRRQDAKSVKNVIDNLIVELEGSKERVRDAYDMTYEYRQPSAAPSAPAKPAATGNLTPAEQAELDQLRKRFGK